MGGNCVFCGSSCISFNPTSHFIFHAVTSTEAVVIAAKYAGVFLLLIYALGYLLCVPPQWYININSIKVYEY